jgi:serine/threonine protein kinase
LPSPSVWHCSLTHITAHEAAYKAGILHRDISVGNIMIIDEGELNDSRGILIDWDLSKVIKQEDEHTGARPYTRIVSKLQEVPLMPDAYSHQGTWQFMAADLISSKIPHPFKHDIESAFWVLMWIVVTYMPTSWDVSRRSFFLKDIMCPKVYGSSGGRNKFYFMTSRSALAEWSITGNEVLTEFLRTLQLVLAVRHMQPPSSLSLLKSNLLEDLTSLDDENSDPKAKADNPKAKAGNAQKDSMELFYDKVKPALENHRLVLHMFRMVLNEPGWPDNDLAEPQHRVPSI